jgi:hypothetical protein
MCDAWTLFLATEIAGAWLSGMRAKVPLSCPAMPSRIRWPFLISTDCPLSSTSFSQVYFCSNLIMPQAESFEITQTTGIPSLAIVSISIA